MKNIQIPESLYVNLVKYFMLDIQNADIYNAIRKDVMVKYEAIEKRSLYSTYKTALTAEEREKARIAYLDKAGIPESFRVKDH